MKGGVGIPAFLVFVVCIVFSSGDVVHAIDRFNVVCIENLSGWSFVDYQLVWGGKPIGMAEDYSKWPRHRVGNLTARIHSWQFQSPQAFILLTPEPHIRFNSDMKGGQSWLEYKLSTRFSPEAEHCSDGARYAFMPDGDSGRFIKLVEKKTEADE